MDNGDDGNDVDDDGGDDDVDMTVFEGPTLPVTCGSKSGILHKCRFAKGVWVDAFLKINYYKYNILCVGQICFTFITTVAPNLFEHFKHT